MFEPIKHLTLAELGFTIDELITLLSHHGKATIPYYKNYELIWCINSDAERAVIMSMGEVRLVVSCLVKPPCLISWDDLKLTYGEDLTGLAEHDTKIVLKHYLRLYYEDKIKEVLKR